MHTLRVTLTLAAAATGLLASPAYNVTAIALPPGSNQIHIAAINNSGQVAGTALDPSGRPFNFLYSPGAGVTTIENSVAPSASTYEGSPVAAMNSRGKILLVSGLLYTPAARDPQDLAVAVRAAFPGEEYITFAGLNDAGTVAGTSNNGQYQTNEYSQHIFRFSPDAAKGVVSLAFANNSRDFPPVAPIRIDDSGNVIVSSGALPYGAQIFTASGAAIQTGCGGGNGWAKAVNNAGQIAGGWGRNTGYPELCTLDPNTYIGTTVALTAEDFSQDGGFPSDLNNRGDVVSPHGNIPTLFADGLTINVNTLFPTGSGWIASSVDRINDGRQIAGVGTLNGVPAAYILSPAHPTNWQLSTVCTTPCAGTWLTTSGITLTQSHGLGFVLSPLRGMAVLPSGSIATSANDIGELAGYNAETLEAFVTTPPWTQFDDLNAVFGWQSGIATKINDGGDVIGSGTSGEGVPISFGRLFAGFNVTSLVDINNARQIVGTFMDSLGQHPFLFDPPAGFATLAHSAIALTNNGNILVGSPAEGYYLQNELSGCPAAILFCAGVLPSGFAWRSINDRDEVVGNSIDPTDPSPAVYYSPATGLIRLQTLVQEPYIRVLSAVNINQAGKILVNIVNRGVDPAAAVLSPESSNFGFGGNP